MQKMTTDDYIVKESMIKATLFPKNYFGGRALLLPNIKRIPGGKSWKSKPALFSVVARSHAVKIFLITNKTIQYASDELVKRLRYVIQNSYEEDSPEGVTLKQLHRIFRQ